MVNTDKTHKSDADSKSCSCAPVAQLSELEHYEQESGANITYQFIVKPGTMGLLSAGRVCLTGPTEKSSDIHASWDQVYVVLAGSGSVIVGETTYPLRAGSIVRIPKGVNHGVVLNKLERLEYCYFNAFQSQKAMDDFCKEYSHLLEEKK